MCVCVRVAGDLKHMACTVSRVERSPQHHHCSTALFHPSDFLPHPAHPHAPPHRSLDLHAHTLDLSQWHAAPAGPQLLSLSPSASSLVREPLPEHHHTHLKKTLKKLKPGQPLPGRKVRGKLPSTHAAASGPSPWSWLLSGCCHPPCLPACHHFHTRTHAGSVSTTPHPAWLQLRFFCITVTMNVTPPPALTTPWPAPCVPVGSAPGQGRCGRGAPGGAGHAGRRPAAGGAQGHHLPQVRGGVGAVGGWAAGGGGTGLGWGVGWGGGWGEDGGRTGRGRELHAGLRVEGRAGGVYGLGIPHTRLTRMLCRAGAYVCARIQQLRASA